MLPTLSSCLHWALWIVALLLFIKGYRRYRYSFGWLFVTLFLPYAAFSIYTTERLRALRRRHADAATMKRASRQVRASSLYLVAAVAAVFIPGVCIFYRVMDGAPKETIAEIPVWTLGTLAAVTLIYGLYAFRFLTEPDPAADR